MNDISLILIGGLCVQCAVIILAIRTAAVTAAKIVLHDAVVLENRITRLETEIQLLKNKWSTKT